MKTEPVLMFLSRLGFAALLAVGCAEPRHDPAVSSSDADTVMEADAAGPGHDAAPLPGADAAPGTEAGPVLADAAGADAGPGADAETDAATTPTDGPNSDVMTGLDGSGVDAPTTVSTDGPPAADAPPAKDAPPVTDAPPAVTDGPPVVADTAPPFVPDALVPLDSPPPECNGTESRCAAVGQATEVCSNGHWTPGKTCDFVCRAGACAGECKPTTKECRTLTPYSCDANGTWVAGTPCNSICKDGACMGLCKPTTKDCGPDDLTPRTCDSNGAWVSGTKCDFLCRNGACAGECVPATHQCKNKVPQICGSDGMWVDTRPSACPVACLPKTGTCGDCEPGSHSCLDPSTPQTCDSNGKWVADAACSGAAPECANGACTCSHTVCGNSCTDKTIDKNNCGVCGRSCQGGPCIASTCKKTSITLTSGATDAYNLLAAGGYLYWAERPSGGGGQLRRVLTTGGQPEKIADADHPSAMTLYNGTLYWSQTGGMYRKNPDTSSTPVQVLQADNSPLPVVATTSPLVVVNNKFCYAGYENMQLADLDGKNLKALAGIPEGYTSTCDSTNAYFSIQPTIHRVPLGGGDEIQYADMHETTSPDIRTMIIGGDGYLYYGTDGYGSEGGYVGRVSLSDPNDLTQVNLAANGAVVWVEKAGTTLYYVLTQTTEAGCTATIAKLPTNTINLTTPTILDTSDVCPGFSQVTSDASTIYWTQGVTMMKIAK